MNIAELFVSLGVKGSDKTVGAIAGVQKGLKDTSSAALETKVALVGAMYALEQLFAASGQKGTDLTNLNALLGVSTKTLQQYEYAARQVGMSNEEMDGTFKALQKAMINITTGGGAPSGMKYISDLVGGISESEIEEMSRKPELLIQRMQQAAQAAIAKGDNPGLLNKAMASFGVGDNFISATRRNAFTPEVLKKAPTYSDKEIGALDKANIAWSNLGNKIQMAVGHFNAMHGGQLVNDISKIVDKVIKLAEAFVTLAEKIKLFELIGQSVKGWTQIFDLITESIDPLSNAIKEMASNFKLFSEFDKMITGWAEIFSDIGEEIKSILGIISAIAPAAVGDFSGKDTKAGEKVQKYSEKGLVPNAITSVVKGLGSSIVEGFKNNPFIGGNWTAEKGAVPTASPVAPKQTEQTVNVNQNLIFNHDGKDAKKTGASTAQAVKHAFYSNPALAGGQ